MNEPIRHHTGEPPSGPYPPGTKHFVAVDPGAVFTEAVLAHGHVDADGVVHIDGMIEMGRLLSVEIDNEPVIEKAVISDWAQTWSTTIEFGPVGPEVYALLTGQGVPLCHQQLDNQGWN